MPRRLSDRSFRVLGVACVVLAGLSATAHAADPPPHTARKTDWAGLDALIASGDYAQAAAMADEIARSSKPKGRDPDFLSRSVDLIRILMRRGLAELRLGRLDAADATFAEASRVFKDADFKRLLAIERRRASPRTETALTLLDINLVELIDFRIAVILARLRLASLGIDESAGGPGEPAGDRAAEVARWLVELDALERTASRAREDLAESFDKGGVAVLSSPHFQSLPGRFRPALAAGARAQELERLEAAGLRPAADTESPAATGRGGVAEARRFFEEAAAALDAALAAAAPKGIAGMKPEARFEAALMRAELLVWEGQALLEAGEPGAGREQFTKALDLQREAATLRRLPRPEAHPDLFVPTLLAAESLLAESQFDLRGGDASGARAAIREASAVLTRADELPVPPEHPLRAWLTSLQSRAVKDLSRVKAAIPGMDAADAAARRVSRAIAGSADPDAGAEP